MPSIHEPTHRTALHSRLQQLTPRSVPLWGVLSASRMVVHLGDQLRVALGDLPAQPRGTLLTRTLVRFLIIQTGMQAPPGKVQTSPEMLTTKPGVWEEDVAQVITLLDRAAAATRFAPHPAFGALSRREWGILSWKHADHHLRQFGV